MQLIEEAEEPGYRFRRINDPVPLLI